MLLQQPTGQSVRRLAGPVFPLGEGDQAVLPVPAEHLPKCLVRPPPELLPQSPQLRFRSYPGHDGSSLICSPRCPHPADTSRYPSYRPAGPRNYGHASLRPPGQVGGHHTYSALYFGLGGARGSDRVGNSSGLLCGLGCRNKDAARLASPGHGHVMHFACGRGGRGPGEPVRSALPQR